MDPSTPHDEVTNADSSRPLPAFKPSPSVSLATVSVGAFASVASPFIFPPSRIIVPFFSLQPPHTSSSKRACSSPRVSCLASLHIHQIALRLGPCEQEQAQPASSREVGERLVDEAERERRHSGETCCSCCSVPPKRWISWETDYVSASAGNGVHAAAAAYQEARSIYRDMNSHLQAQTLGVTGAYERRRREARHSSCPT